MHTTTYIERNNSGEVAKKITAPSFTEYEVPECTNTPDGSEFVCWCLNDEYYFEPGDLRSLNNIDMTVKAIYMPLVETTYTDENGIEQTVKARRIYDTDYKLYLTEGWYIVDSNINLVGGIRYTGDVKLIIADGKTLSFTRYSVSGQDPYRNAFWAVDEDYKPSKVTVYGQTQQTGVLDIGARYPYFYDFTINGGTVKITDVGFPDQGLIMVYKTCTVNRGTLTADRIFCDHLVLNGGNVDITHAHSFTESLLGWKKQSDSFVLGYYGNNLQIADGQAFTDENGNIYEGSLTTEQIESLQVKTLTPYIAHDYADPEWIWDNEYTDAKAVFRCRDCNDVQTVRAKVTYSDDSNIRTSEAKCEFLGETFTATHEGKIVFDISITPSEHGTVTVKRAQEKPGENVDLIVEPEEGYVSKLLTVTDSGHHEVPMSGDSFIMPESDVTVSAAFIRDKVYHSRIEPYIDENGAYVLDVKEHYEFSGKNYAVNEDGSLGEELSDISLSYFEFKLNGETYQINRYTGPAINGKLIIPKTFNGKKITVLGNDEQENLYNRDKTQFELVLNENITEIKPYTFYLLYVTKLSGDTSGLSKLGKYAFSWANSPGGYTLDIKLDYPGVITAGYEMFNNMYVTARVKHATTFSSSQLSAKKIDYIFTDDHTYGNPIWTWSDDNSAATAAFTCTDTRCNHQETVDATITRGEAVEGKVLLTASVEVNGTTYTNEKEVFADSMGARLVGHSISLDGDIAVNFYMELSDSVIAHKDTAYMHFTIPVGSGTTEQKMLVKDALIKEWNGKDYYVFKCRVAAKEMTSEIKAQMIDGDQNGTEYIYSVKEYADYLIEHADEREDLAAAVPLVKKMLNYGAYAQIYFDKNPGTLANEIMDETEKELGDVTITAPETAFDLPAGVTFGGATLSLKSETTLSIYFKSNTTLTFSCGDYTVETAASGGYQIARIRGIKAKHIGDTFTLTVNGGTVTYSPLNYCKSVLPDSTASPDEAQNQQDEKLQNVVKALYLYWQAADAYFPE